MSEGGIYPWKRQSTVVPPNGENYSCIKNPLPTPPKGSEWTYDSTNKAWTVVSKKNKNYKKIIEKNKEDATHDDYHDRNISTQSSPSSSFIGKRRNETSILYACTSPVTSTVNGSSYRMDRNKDDLLLEPKTENHEEDDDSIEYIEHVVLPTDTFQGICLAYNISGFKLRQMNCFSGTSLLLAPSILRIPVSKHDLQCGRVKTYHSINDEENCNWTKDDKIHILRAQFPSLYKTEAAAYLELMDWSLEDAIQAVTDGQNKEKRGQILKSSFSSELFQVLGAATVATSNGTLNNANYSSNYGSISTTTSFWIIAPIDLPGKFQFVISLKSHYTIPNNCDSNNKDSSNNKDNRNNLLLIEVPEDGVKRGEAFEPIIIHNHNNECSDDYYYPPAGRWKEDICDCGYRGFSADNCLGCCCPQLLLGQIQTRLKLPCWGIPTPLSSNNSYITSYKIGNPSSASLSKQLTNDKINGEKYNNKKYHDYQFIPVDGDNNNDNERGFQYEEVEIASYDTWVILTVLFVFFIIALFVCMGSSSSGGNMSFFSGFFILQGCLVIIILGIAITCTRKSLRSRYGIPGTIYEDCCCSFCCTCCVLTQMSRHTANYKRTRATCCFATTTTSNIRIGLDLATTAAGPPSSSCYSMTKNQQQQASIYHTASVGYMKVKIKAKDSIHYYVNCCNSDSNIHDNKESKNDWIDEV